MDKFARLICGAVVLAMSATAAKAADAVVDTGTIASFGDPDTALKRIGPQARRGNARAEALLGYMYEHGLGVPQSWPAAVDCYLLAAEQGDAAGQYLLGLMYDKGFGVSATWCRPTSGSTSPPLTVRRTTANTSCGFVTPSLPR
jgi:TPR repeat protein